MITINEKTEVGRFYSVMCVKTGRHTSYGGAWMPVNGPWHEDKDIIGFPDSHWHIDWRFVSKRVYQNIASYYGRPNHVHSRVLTMLVAAVDTPELHRRLCHRAMPEFPTAGAWMRKLEDAFADRRVECLKCPHRGFDLRTGTDNGDGTITCSGHGLRWNIETGTLVRRMAQAVDTTASTTAEGER